MTKIIVATDNYLPRWDGISRFLSEIVPRLAKNHDITVIAPDFGKTKKPKNYTLEKIPVMNITTGDIKPARPQYMRISKIIKDADAVFTQTLGFVGMCAILAAKRHNKPIISFTHSIEWELFPKAVSMRLLKKILYPIAKTFVRFMYNKSDLLIIPSDSISDKLMWQKIHTPKKTVHLGINGNKFVSRKKRSVRKELGLKTNDFIVGYHGRLGREKDLKTLLRGFVRFRTKHDRVKLLIVGAGVEDVEDMFKDKKGVIFPGQQDNVIPWIQAMDVYVLPSFTETSSLSTLEAMACETAVIATKVGFVKDYINDGENGLFFRQQHAYDLSKKLETLYQDSKLRSKLGRNARKTVMEKFKWQNTADGIMRAIDEILQNEKKE